MRSINQKVTLLALFIGLMIFSNHLLANVNVLIIGSTHDSSEQLGGNSKPFSPTAIGTQLQSILSGSGLGSVNVVVTDRYATGSTVMGQTSYAFNLASWYHWPFPKGAESARWANLRGEAGTVWDYVVLIGDPYTMEYTPGVYAYGAAKIAEEVAKGSAETILLMPWPATGSSRNIAHYKDVVYRAGRSGGIKVAPGGLAWQAIKGAALTNPNPNADGAFIAAASIYSTIYNQSAAVSTYVYNDTWANTVNTTESTNRTAQQYTGGFTFQNPYLFRSDSKRQIYFSSRGTSTESYFKGAAESAIGRSRVSVTSYCPWNRSETDWATNGGDEPWTKWPVSFVPPIAWNDGRDGATSEWYKSYQVNPAYWDFAYGYMYQTNTWSKPVEDANDHFVSMMFANDNDLANRMMSQGNSARNLPVRTLWAQIHKELPSENPLMDGSGPHLSQLEHEAVGTYMYTLYSGRCPLDPEPATLDKTWVARKIGYETAWRLGRCQMRAPGFKVMPSATAKKSITPGEKETMTVQFILPPKQDVTVNVSISNANAAVVGSQQLLFTPQNFNVPQNVVVAGLAGSAASETFNVVFTTVSTDEVYNGLSDTWDYTITRSAPVTLTRVNKATNLVTAYQNLPVTINLNTAGATSTNTVLAGPSRGTAVWSGSNVIYTPSSDFLGKDGFSFATNNAGTLSVGYVEITVTAAAVNGMVSYRGNGSDGGTVPVDSGIYAQNATVTVLGNTGTLTRVGYNFAGWNTAANGSGTNYAAGATFTMGASGVILYAKWIAVPTYTVTYNGNSNTSGSVPYNQTKTDGVNLTLATNIGTLARTGYTFSGWNTAADGTGTAYAVGAVYSGNANLTLYAKWTIITYAVNYNANSATSGTTPANQIKTYGVNLTLQTNSGNLARAGYTFAGWNTAAAGTGTNYAVGANYTANAGVTLYAKWTPGATYMVSYNANGATAGTVPADQTKQTDVALTLATNTGLLARTGYTFAGWNTAADGTGTPYAAGASYTANAAVVLYAQWAGAATYAVTYNGNGSTGGSAPVDASSPYTNGATVTVLGNTGILVRTGYTFNNWNTAANGSGTNYSPAATFSISTPTTLYAQWTPNTYAVTYNANSATSGTAPSNQTKTHDVSLTLQTNSGTLARTGYTFSGWNTLANGTGTDYAVGANYIANAALTLYAKWTPNTYAVTYDANFASSGTAPAAQTKTQDVNLTLQTNSGTLARTGYTFSGWNTQANGAGTDYAVGATYTANAALTLYAKWTASFYTVSYNANSATSGTAPANQTKTHDVSLTLQTNSGSLARTGYTFSGWNTQADGLGASYAVASAYTVNAAVILYAKWTVNTYAVTYNANSATSGTVPAAQTKTHDVSLTLQNNTGTLARTGYTFAGWNTQADGLGTNYAVASAYTANTALALYAKWTANTYAVTYNANSATSGTVPAAQTKTHDVSLTLQNNTGTLARTGYTFAGWNTQADGLGTSYAVASAYTANAAVTLYAKWTPNTYAVTYNANSATSGTAPAAQTKTQDINLTLQNNTGTLARTGYTFAGWNTQADGLGTDYAAAGIYTANAAVTLYAKWTIITYAVTYNANSATSGTAPAAQVKTYGVSLTLQNNTGTLARTGYTFAGWNTQADGLGTSYAVASAYTANAALTLYAKWTANTYAVTYNANSATSGTAPVAQTKTHDVSLTLQNNTGSLARTGYTFSGWNAQADGLGTNYAVASAYTANAAVTLYAKWTINTYAVTYNANSATSGTAPAAQTKTYGVSLTLQTNSGTLARTGYTFSGWNTQADGLGTTYAVASAYTANAAVTLYAKWTADTYAVTYNANSATSGTAPANQTKTYGVDLPLQTNSGTLVRTNYTFSGWNTLANGTGIDYAAGSTYTSNAALALYAKWTPNTYSVTYNANSATSGTVPSNQNKTHGVDLTLHTNSGSLARTGFTFGGWNTLANGTGTDHAVGSTYSADAALTLYAKWISGTFLTWDANGGVSNQTDGAGEWTNANQWWNGTANTAWSSSANAIFGNGGAGGAVTLASPATANSLTFNSFTGTYTLGTAAQSLTINGGIQKSAASGIVSISSPVVIGANQTWTNNSSSGLTASSTVNNGGFTVTVDGTGATTMSGVISGNGGFVKNGSGRFTFGASTNANTYAGPTTINGGTLSIANNTASLGSGNLTLNGGVLGFYWSAGLTRTLGTGDNQVSIPGGESGFGGDGGSGPTVNLGTTVVWGGAGQGTATGHFNPSKFVLGSPDTGNAGATTFSSAIDLNGSTRTIVAPKGLSAGGNVSTISGAITSTGAAGLIKEGGGTLVLSAVNTYTGNTTISGGTLRIGSNTTGTLNSGNYAGNISITSGATLQIWSSAAQTLSGIISGNGGLHKAYGGALTLSGPNTYTGRTSFLPQNTAGFTVNITSFNSVNGGTPLLASSSLGAPTTIANGTIDVGDGGKQAGVNLTYTGPGETTDRVINFGFNGTASHTLTASGGGPLKFISAMTSNATTQSGSLILRGTGNGEITQALPALPSGGLSKNDAGTWTLGGANSYTGPTAILAGKLLIHGNQTLATGAVTVSANATLGGTGTLGGNTTIAASGKLEFNLSTAAASHDKLDLAATRSLTFSGASTLTITSTGGASPGSYTLLTAPGGITGTLPTLSLPANWAATVSIVGNDIVLNVTSTGNTYNVTYNSNSATSGTAPSNQTKNNGVSLTLATNTGTLARTGYTFAGWNTQADGMGVTYAEGATYTTNAALTLFAKWTMLPYTSWADSSGLSGGNTASTANPDGDTLTNLQEFAFGMNPTSPSLAPLSYVANGTTTGGTPVLEKPGATYRAVFARRKDYAAAGLTYAVSFSADLSLWTVDETLPTRLSGDNADTMEAVSIDFPTSVPLQAGGSAAPKFFRVTVTGN